MQCKALGGRLYQIWTLCLALPCRALIPGLGFTLHTKKLVLNFVSIIATWHPCSLAPWETQICLAASRNSLSKIWLLTFPPPNEWFFWWQKFAILCPQKKKKKKKASSHMVKETFEKNSNKKSPHVEEKMNGFTNILLEKLSRFLAFWFWNRHI